jgi:hypothetical protein
MCATLRYRAATLALASVIGSILPAVTTSTEAQASPAIKALPAQPCYYSGTWFGDGEHMSQNGKIYTCNRGTWL